MRKIEKQQTPACLQAFIDGERLVEPESVNLTYTSFREKKELLNVLTREQFGLCGYTGVPVDQRIAVSTPSAAFKNHIEHLKSQDTCKQELQSRGGIHGRDWCEDLEYRNLIAALEVKGAEREQFGAVKKKNRTLPILPTQDRCDEPFQFDDVGGGVQGMNQEAKNCIEILDLDHQTLKRWRDEAIQTWLDFNVVTTAEDFERVVSAMENPTNGVLPEFAFVIGSIAKRYLPTG